MPDLGWVVPVAVAVTATVFVVLVTILAVRALHRSPRARAAADRAVADVAVALLALDDAVRDLDLDVETADAADSPDVPAELRRARSAAHRARDRGYDDLLALEADTGPAARRRNLARTIRASLDAHRRAVADARVRFGEWARAHRTAAHLLDAVRRRRDELVASAGDSGPLVASLRARFDEVDWAGAAAASTVAAQELTGVDAALVRAAEDPEGDHLRAATAALHRSERALRGVEDDHRIALQAADNVEAEMAAARAELQAAIAVATSRPGDCRPGAAERLRSASAALEDAAASGARRPREAIATVARVREERDDLLGDAVSTRRRLEAARIALPGTLACARAAFASAETQEVTVDARAADAPSSAKSTDDDRERLERRLRLERARRHLAEARAATDATRALSAARDAWSALR